MKASFVSMFCLSFTANVNVAAHIVVLGNALRGATIANRLADRIQCALIRVRSMLDCSDVDSNDRPKAEYVVVKTR